MADLVIMDPPQPPAHRLLATCDRHPDENFTGFCTSCLRERLQSLESASTTATTHRNSTSTISSSLKSIFFVKPTTSSTAAANDNNNNNYAISSSSSELRRCKSFSCGRGDGFSAPRLSTSFEPQRKSCDVRGRNTLWSLFNQDDNARILNLGGVSSSAAAGIPSEIEIQAHGDDENEITPAVATDPTTVEMPMSCEINASDEKPMKDHIHIDLESQAKPNAGGFWLAASVFSKKLQEWRRKQKLKKFMKKKRQQDGRNRSSYSSARFRETQSEMAVDAFGRRSLDLDPRLSLDAGRISFEDQRYSFDEPRASWDGYLIGSGRSVPSRPPPMLSVVEDSPAPALLVQRTDGEIPVEEDLFAPGPDHAAFSRSQRPSLDRSTSKRSSVELNDTKSAVMSSNAKLQLSPDGSSNDLFRDWSSNSLRDDRSESFDSAFPEEDSSSKLPPRKKSKRWSKAWSIWGFIHRRSTGGRGGAGNVQVDRVSFSEAWPELMRTNGYHANGRIFRSNSSVSSRSSSYGINAGFGSRRRNGVAESNGIGKKRRDEYVLDRNPSHARFSPGHVDNGMLRFYLTPMRGSRRGSGKAKHSTSYHSFARSVLQLY